MSTVTTVSLPYYLMLLRPPIVRACTPCQGAAGYIYDRARGAQFFTDDNHTCYQLDMPRARADWATNYTYYRYIFSSTLYS